MAISLKPLKDLTGNHHKADYKSGGNYQTSYYRFLEEGGTRAPEVRVVYADLTCDYILATTVIPFEIVVRTYNKFVGALEVITTLGESVHTSTQSPNEAYTYTFNANTLDVSENTELTIDFKGFNKFGEDIVYSIKVTYLVEKDCVSLGCESNSHEVAFLTEASGRYTLSVNGKMYSLQNLSELKTIEEDNDLTVKFYRQVPS